MRLTSNVKLQQMLNSSKRKKYGFRWAISINFYWKLKSNLIRNTECVLVRFLDVGHDRSFTDERSFDETRDRNDWLYADANPLTGFVDASDAASVLFRALLLVREAPEMEKRIVAVD